MKRVLIIAVLLTAGGQLLAQDAISNYFSKYEVDEGFTNVTITSRMFGLFTNLEVEDAEDQAVLDAISKLEGLKILAKDHTLSGKKLYMEALSKLPKNQYDELMSVRDEDNNMKFMIKEKGGKISELVMVMGGNEEFFILSLYGEIDLKQIAKISKAMDIDGLEGLEKLGDRDKNN